MSWPRRLAGPWSDAAFTKRSSGQQFLVLAAVAVIVAAAWQASSWTEAAFVGSSRTCRSCEVDCFPRPAPQFLQRAAVGDEVLAKASSKHILVVSDSTGRTAAGLADRLLAQFGTRSEIPEVTIVPEITTVEKLSDVIQTAARGGSPVLVMATLVDGTMAQWARTLCKDSNLPFIDVMTPLIDEFSSFLEETAVGVPGGAPKMNQRNVAKMVNREFFGMVEAVKFGQRHVAGLNAQDWWQADLILIGPSRVGKGPVAHYLAQRGVKAASLNTSPNEPLPPELESVDPSKVAVLLVQEDRLVGLRESRLREAQNRNMPMLLEPDYASVERVRADLEFTRKLMESFPDWDEPVDITSLPVEECTSLLFRRVAAARKRMQVQAR
eukprot:TRINITY_DN17313_c0_g1_i1.p1 TRINITY_DN17313_c0_g1~~TRINITY_DN17313_c0_g1_i1.p1  ORF type:complete len:381 (-),score=75.59 TRINITY_DN17313_c0_g1_i1:260-1402(-)